MYANCPLFSSCPFSTLHFSLRHAPPDSCTRPSLRCSPRLQEFDAIFSSSDLSFGRGRADKSKAIRIDLRELTAGQETADGVHFGLQVYDAVEQCILNALQYLCGNGGRGKEQSKFCSRATTRIHGKTVSFEQSEKDTFSQDDVNSQRRQFARAPLNTRSISRKRRRGPSRRRRKTVPQETWAWVPWLL